MRKIALFVPLVALVLVGSSSVQCLKAQSQDSITDLNFGTYFGNPDQYTDVDADITGKVFHLIPASVGISGIQIYQGGDRSRDIIIQYEISDNLGPFSEDDCVKVKGTASGSYEYTNAYGGSLSAPLIKADSIAVIPCTQVVNPAQNVVNIEQSQTKSGIKITLHKVEFSDKNTRAYLTVENNNKNTEITFYDFNARALQGNRQFETTSDYDVDYPDIKSSIPAGIVEDGVVIFEPFRYDQGNAKLEFGASKNYNDVKFTFDVKPSSTVQSTQQPDLTPAISNQSLTKQVIPAKNNINPQIGINKNPKPTENIQGIHVIDTWGSTGNGDGQFNHPASIENDLSGQRIYVADLDNNRIQVLDSDGDFVTKWGSTGSGDGQFNAPGAIAVDDNLKVVFVSDIRNNRIQKFDTEGNFIKSWGTLGKAEGQFDHPGDIALNPEEETIYVTDIYNNRVQKFYYDGNFITQWGSLGTGDGQLNRPAGITVNPAKDIVYVADTVNDRIQVFDGNGSFIDKWKLLGSGYGQFNRPDGILFDNMDNLIYVSDRKNNRIVVLDDEGRGTAQLDLSALSDGLSVKPRDVALDSSGNLYVLDKLNNNIRLFSQPEINHENVSNIRTPQDLSQQQKFVNFDNSTGASTQTLH